MTKQLNVPGVRWILVPALIFAVLIAFSEGRQLHSPPEDAVQHLGHLRSAQPWGGLATQDAMRRLESSWQERPSASLDELNWALRRYPLSAEAWLLRTRILRQLQGLAEETRQSLHAALSIQPHSRELNWMALSLAESFEDQDLVARLLRGAIASRPHESDRALFAAARWFPDPDERIDRVLPQGDAYLTHAVQYGVKQDLPDLAAAAWQRLERLPEPDRRVFRDYLRLQRSHGRGDRVLDVLVSLDPAHRRGRLPAGDFSVSLDALNHLGWNLRMPDGVRLVRDESDLPPGLAAPHPHAPLSAASLRVEFDGTENVNLNAPRVRFRAAESGHYRLTGWWKAENLTTRALPALEVRLVGSRYLDRLDVPATSFPWQPFSFDLTIGESMPAIQLSLVRADTQAFDRYIRGTLSLAGLMLEPADAPAKTEAP